MISCWLSPAKINLFLYITGKRDDGYHTIQTLFQIIDYYDIISIEPLENKQINLLPSIKGIPIRNNLIFRAANLLMQTAIKDNRLTYKKGANIYIKKNIPIGSGLGGGSSNAATVLVALNYIWNCKFSKARLANIGLSLGADIPVFIYGRTAIAEGIGEVLYPISYVERWYLIVNPGLNIPTHTIFSKLELKKNRPIRSIETLMNYKFSNDCENIVKKHFNKINLAIFWLSKYAQFRLTGTGSCIFAEFNTQSEANQILKIIPKWLSGFVAKGLNISPLLMND